jgi:steroid delta-isomerase-like uncharacterized protein
VHSKLCLATALALGLSACGPRPQVGGSPVSPAPAAAEFSYGDYIDAVYNKRDPAAIDHFFTSDVVVHSVTPGVEGGSGTEYLKQLAQALLAAFPDLKISVDDVVRDGDRLAARVTITGTQDGEFAGIKATGKQVTAANFAIYRLKDGKIAEVWSLVDLASIKRQLGHK